jgi:hypothetical protein
MRIDRIVGKAKTGLVRKREMGVSPVFSVQPLTGETPVRILREE